MAKRAMRIAIYLFVLILLINTSIWAGTGTTAAQFLNKATGARPAGMGNCFVAVADDLNAICWNPAGLAFLNKRQASFMYSDISNVFQVEGAGNMYHGFLAYINPWGKGKTGGLSLQYEEQGKIAYTTGSPEVIAEYDLGANSALSFSYAIKLRSHLGGGINLKVVRTKLWKYEGTAYGIDVGLLYRGERINAGISLRNFGTKLIMKDAYQADSLPQDLRFGLSYKLLSGNPGKLTVAIDLTKPLDLGIQVSSGIEYWYANLLALRIGYLDEGGGVTGFTQGIGIRYKGYQVDFASIPWGELGTAQKISLTIYF